MNLAARPWLLAVVLGLLALCPVHAGMTPEEVKAFEGFKAKAEKGDRVAQHNLGYCYYNGEGVAKDLVQAVSWYRKAADQGLAHAQFNLAYMYANGQGVPKDDAEAVKWYRKAADQGLAQAQFNLALMYQDGQGVAKDDAEAVKWYRKAADQGHAQAQHNLGLMYLDGEGVPKDEIEAYACLNLAGMKSEFSRKKLAILEKGMSPDARLLGQQRTKQLQKEIENREIERLTKEDQKRREEMKKGA